MSKEAIRFIRPKFDISNLGVGEEVYSVNSPVAQSVIVRFKNCSGGLVDILWIDESRKGVRYAQLKVGQFLDIKTFEGHPWVFRHFPSGAVYYWSLVKSVDGKPVLSPPAEVYWPSHPGVGIVTRTEIYITRPEIKLLDICIARISHILEPDYEKVTDLPVPQLISDKITEYSYRYMIYSVYYGKLPHLIFTSNRQIAPVEQPAGENQ